MYLVYSVALLGLATVIFVIVLVGARAPVKPAWAAHWLVDDMGCVAITALIGFGLIFVGSFVFSVQSQPIELMEITLATGIAAAYYLILRLIAPRRRLAEYALQRAEPTGSDREPSSTEIIQLVSPAGEVQPQDKQILFEAA